VSDTVSEELSALPEYLHYIPTVIEVQKELGGSSKPAKIFDLVLDRIEESNKPYTGTAISNPSQFNAEMQRVRKTLVHAGLLDSAQKGVWTLTKKGLVTEPSDIDLHRINELRKRAERGYREKRKSKTNGSVQQPETTRSTKKTICVREDHRRRLLDQLKALSPADLEKVCQDVLRRSGFERVSILGQGSEDCFYGECIFQENPLRRSYVAFQFKCVQGLIGEEEVRDFRNAMMRRVDKGIFMTICSFTARARLEAQRDGVSPVILIDGNNLVDMIQKFKIQLEAA
jgi:restriction system protein